MQFKLGIFCSESPKWKWKLFQPPCLSKRVLLGLFCHSLVSLGIDWSERGIWGYLYTPLVNAYSLLLTRMTFSGMNPCTCGWLSASSRFADVGGSIWTQTFMETAHVSSYLFALLFASISSCIMLCLLFSLHGSLPSFTMMSLQGRVQAHSGMWVQIPASARVLCPCFPTPGLKAFLWFIAGIPGVRGELLQLCHMCWL